MIIIDGGKIIPDTSTSHADYRVISDRGNLMGYLVDLALDEDKTPGSQGFDAFLPDGTYHATAGDMTGAAETLFAHNWR